MKSQVFAVILGYQSHNEEIKGSGGAHGMNVSQLILELEKLKTEYGDLEVNVCDEQGNFPCVFVGMDTNNYPVRGQQVVVIS